MEDIWIDETLLTTIWQGSQLQILFACAVHTLADQSEQQESFVKDTHLASAERKHKLDVTWKLLSFCLRHLSNLVSCYNRGCLQNKWQVYDTTLCWRLKLCHPSLLCLADSTIQLQLELHLCQQGIVFLRVDCRKWWLPTKVLLGSTCPRPEGSKTACHSNWCICIVLEWPAFS